MRKGISAQPQHAGGPALAVPAPEIMSDATSGTPRAIPDGVTAALELNDVSRRYGRHWALVHLSFTLRRGPDPASEEVGRVGAPSP